MRHTTFRYALDPTPTQEAQLLRHAGAARFAYNQCLELVRAALDAQKLDPKVRVPWTRVELINAFNRWKTSEDAGHRFVASPDGTVELEIMGLSWRAEVCQQVFENAASDLGQALAAWDASRKGARPGARISFPKFKEKNRSRASFRLRNNEGGPGRPRIRLGERHPRLVTLPKLGAIRVHNDTRPLRRLLRPTGRPDPVTGKPSQDPRARIRHVIVTRQAGRWYIAIAVEAPDLHPAHQHPPHPADDPGGWVGVDLGLTHLVVAATANRIEVGRWSPPRTMARALPRLRRQARIVNRRQRGSGRRAKAARRLSRTHARVTNQRHWWLHQITKQLVKTHDRLALETLAISNLLRNRTLARAITDAAWGELRRQLTYKQRWRHGQLRFADRWLASSKTCSQCGQVKPALSLAERVYRCEVCGLVCDRDVNAASNLAAWAEKQVA